MPTESSWVPGCVGNDVFAQVGVDEDNAAALRSLLIYLVNHAIHQRSTRIQMKRHLDELEAEIAQLQVASCS